MERTIEKTLNGREQLADGEGDAWQSALELCGDQFREGTGREKADDPVEKRVCARSYTLKQAARLAGVNPATLRHAATELALDSFLDPRGKVRFPVYSFKPTAADPDLSEMIAGYERLRPDDLCAALGIDRRRLRSRLSEADISAKHMTWRDVRGLWNLPETFAGFSQLLSAKTGDAAADKTKRKRGSRSRRRRRQDARKKLRNRLIDAFPKWRNAYREHQQLVLHIGAPNSGKTHDALQALKDAGSGWYLAPLRLLAYEILRPAQWRRRPLQPPDRRGVHPGGGRAHHGGDDRDVQRGRERRVRHRGRGADAGRCRPRLGLDARADGIGRARDARHRSANRPPAHRCAGGSRRNPL